MTTALAIVGPMPVTQSTSTDRVTEPEELTPEEQELLDQAIGNLQKFIEEQSTHYAFVDEEEPTEEELKAIESEED